MLKRAVILLFAVVLSIVVLTSMLYAPHAEAAKSCSGKNVYPSQDLASVAASSPDGTTFCIHDGTYSISSPVKVGNKDRFIGVYNDSTRPEVKTTKALQVFNANSSSGAVIEGLKISGAVGGNYCEPGCGQGIRGGNKLTVRDAWITGNKNNGIGGAGSGLLVENSTIDRNGSYSFTILDGGKSSAAGIKSAQSPLTVRNSTISNNYWSGVWCDIDCDALTVEGSTITGNGKAGIQDEVSEGPALIRNNMIKGNGVLPAAQYHVGLLISNSANIDVYGNTFGGNVDHGIQVIESSRPPDVRNVRIHNNTMNGDTIASNSKVGCTIVGVTCSKNS